jgi:hypothetical protein
VNVRRREFLRLAGAGLVGTGASAAWLCRSSADDVDGRAAFNVRSFGATGDGKAVDTPAARSAYIEAFQGSDRRRALTLLLKLGQAMAA